MTNRKIAFFLLISLLCTLLFSCSKSVTKEKEKEKSQSEPLFTQTELEQIASSLHLREIALSNSGSDYILSILPRSITVTQENQPESRLNQLESYLKEHKDEIGISYLGFTSVLQTASQEGETIYTEDGQLNEQGLFYVYQALYQAFPTNVTEKFTLLSQTDTEERYSILENHKNMFVTYAKPGFKKEMPNRPSLLIENDNQAETEVLSKFFSNTFGCVGYKNDYIYTASSLESVLPDMTVQILHEDSLSLLLDEKIALSYHAGLKPGDDPTTTASPVLLYKSYIESNRIVLGGTVEKDAVLTVSGTPNGEFTENAQGTTFFLSIEVPENAKETVQITAKLADKKASIPLTVDVEYDANAGVTNFFVGHNSSIFLKMHIDDFCGTNLFSAQQLAKIEENTLTRVKKIQAASGKKTKMIYVVVPNPSKVMPEFVPDYIASQKVTDASRLSQIKEIMQNKDDVIFIDLTDTMLQKKGQHSLIQQTDTHWTEYSAFLGYTELMNVIAKDFPNVAPYALDQFTIEPSTSIAGDFFAEKYGLTEDTEYLIPNFTPKNAFYGVKLLDTLQSGHFFDPMESTIADPSLPSAVLVRDSFATNFVKFMGEHFQTLSMQKMWDHFIEYDRVERVKPDYVIHLLVENNLEKLLTE